MAVFASRFKLKLYQRLQPCGSYTGQDGTLQKRLYDFFVNDEMRKPADGEDVEVNVTIEEEEYQKACLELMNESQGIKYCTIGFLPLSPAFSGSLNLFCVQSMGK